MKMRLIDAEAFEKQVVAMAIMNGYAPQKANALCELINKQPTAYDVDKVAEQLEEYLFEKYCIEGDTKINEIVKRRWGWNE
jgi:hypothetical protein